MSDPKIWPSGTENSIPTVYNIPEIQDLNWAGAVTDLLVAFASGAQSTTFQRWSFQVVTGTTYTMTESDCVVISAPSPVATVAVTLPAVTYKRVLIFADGIGQAGGSSTTTMTCQPGETINGGGSTIALNSNWETFVLIGDSDNNTWRTLFWDGT